MIENRLSTLLGARRKSIADLARESGLAYRTCYELWAGRSRRVDFATLDALCRTLGVTVCDILDYQPDAARGETTDEGHQRMRAA